MKWKLLKLEEDTEAGIEMIGMAHERERKLKKEISEMKENDKLIIK